VRDPDGRVLVDRDLKAPGRGAHLSYDREAIEQAVKRRAFGRAFKAPVEPVTVEDLVEQVLRAIDQRVTNRLAIARRARHAVSGTDMVERTLGSGRAHLVVMAGDTAAATADRLRRKAAANEVPVEVFQSREDLGSTQGTEERVVIAITHAETARALALEFARRRRVLVAGES
jgi:ribosomal protein L7Ae-like RNA K-turn-binding protein